MVGERFRDVPRLGVQPQTVGELHGEPSPQKGEPYRTAPERARQVGRRVAYIIKDWHSHDQYLMDTLARRCRDVLALRRRQRRRTLSGRRIWRRLPSENSLGADRQPHLGARASAPAKPIRCSTRTAAPGISTTCSSVTALHADVRQRQPDADHPSERVPRRRHIAASGPALIAS